MKKNKMYIIFMKCLIIFFTISESSAYSKKDMFYEKIKEVVEIVDLNYVQDIDYDKALNDTIQAFLNSFDPLSQYYSTESQVDNFISLQKGERSRIGIKFIYDIYTPLHSEKTQVLKIISVLEGSVAHKSSLEVGDVIIAINDKQIKNFTNMHEILKEIQKGGVGSKISLLIKKEKIQNPIKIEVKKELATEPTIELKMEPMNRGVVCYLKIIHFNKKTLVELKKTLKEHTAKLKTQNKKCLALILDLRDNPGGLLEQAVAISEYFLKQGVIVKVKNRYEEKIYRADEKSEKFLDIPIVVLINSQSASASEIVAAALQDNKRALLVGTTTFGKATVQKLLNINQNSAIKITTSVYYTPNGKSIDKHGIVPDILVTQQKPYIIDENQDNNLVDLDKVYDNSEYPEADIQYKRAWDLILSMLFLKQR